MSRREVLRRGSLGVVLSTALLAMVGCGAEREPELVLAAPSELRATALGPIEGPAVLLSDGSEPEGVIWTVSHPEVVEVQRNRVVAVGPGSTGVTAEWEGERVGFDVVVALDTRLSFLGAPETLRVGDVRELELVALLGDVPVDPGRVHWSTSDPEVLRVDDGSVTPVLPGTAWITARARGASAMVELEVVP